MTTVNVYLRRIALACGALLAAAYIRTHETDLTLTLPLAMVAFGAATVLWLLGNKLASIIVGAMALLVFLAPQIVVWAAIAVLALAGSFLGHLRPSARGACAQE